MRAPAARKILKLTADPTRIAHGYLIAFHASGLGAGGPCFALGSAVNTIEETCMSITITSNSFAMATQFRCDLPAMGRIYRHR